MQYEATFQVRQVIKDHVSVNLFSLNTVVSDKIFTAPVATFDIRDIYPKHQEDHSVMHTHDFYLVTWITEGRCDYYVDMEEYKISPNTILLLKPGYMHRFTNVAGLGGINFYFTPDVLLNANSEIGTLIDVDLFGKNRIIRIKSENTREMLDAVFQGLRRVCMNASDSVVDKEERRLEMLVLLLTLWKCDEVKKDSVEKDIAQSTYQMCLRFQSMVDEKYMSYHKVQEYAECLNVSTKHLTECVRRHLKQSPLQAINHRLLVQSKRLLLFSRMRVKEIAMELGFADTSQFVKFFKRGTGVNPSQYREG
ncbi:MAG: AraC family transcriptional regulator [Candidatus Aphodosoma sp.]